MLKDVGTGLSKAETVKHLNEKFGISKSAGYWHFETKDRWLKDYGDFNNVNELRFRILTQFEHINREASFEYLQSRDQNAKIGFMRVRLEALGKLSEFLPKDVEVKQTPETVVLTWGLGAYEDPEMQKRIDDLIKISREAPSKIQSEVLDRGAEISELLKSREVLDTAISEALTPGEAQLYHDFERKVVIQAVEVARRAANGESLH